MYWWTGCMRYSLDRERQMNYLATVILALHHKSYRPTVLFFTLLFNYYHCLFVTCKFPLKRSEGGPNALDIKMDIKYNFVLFFLFKLINTWTIKLVKHELFSLKSHNTGRGGGTKLEISVAKLILQIHLYNFQRMCFDFLYYWICPLYNIFAYK